MPTIIRVPGKRKRPTSSSDDNGALHKLTRRPGRPRKDALSSSLDGRNLKKVISVNDAQYALDNFHNDHELSTLERLPTEILERIFSYSMNFNLPRSSDILGAKLSSRFVFLDIAIGAFAPSWQFSYDHSRQAISGDEEQLPATVDPPGDPELQSLLLSCRWAKGSLIRQAEGIWLHRHELERAHTRRANGAHEGRPSEPTAGRQSVDEALAHGLQLPALSPQDGDNQLALSLNSVSLDERFESQYGRFLEANKPLDNPFRDSLPTSPLEWSSDLKIHPKTEIPENLLRGPWSAETLKHLFWLTCAGATIDHEGSTVGEVAKRGLCRAIEEGNLAVLHLMQCLGVEAGMTEDIFAIAARCQGNKLNVSLRLIHMLANQFPENEGKTTRWASDIVELALKSSTTAEDKLATQLWTKKLLAVVNARETHIAAQI